MTGNANRPQPNRLESEGAEFLVLATLLIERIEAFKAYGMTWPGYDLIATDTARGTSCRVQVKSRRATEDGRRGFPLRNIDCDFVVMVALNRGTRRVVNGDDGRRAPDQYVIPIEVVRPLVRVSGAWSKVLLRDIDDVDQYLGAWDLIRAHLRNG